ncbi:hypothetical protein J7T55_005529 [Diaporthe amygdali]|uniref:uncharacterized protein n=1 Tax=Phomopsis amygdali TaxID=1214568 RepID=UPI0022FF1536|nr:uncharacterized protein J7T55_005529 [Diaporthe amygdali]KAJ0108981.1 hypothetical protein J7T55_005529 [Diaporthe amygdali]
MFSKLSVLGLVAAIPLSLAAALPSNLTYRATEFLPKNATGDFSVQAAPQYYSGPWQNFPAMNTWVSTFDALFEANKNSIRSTGSTADDVGRINVAIREAAKIGVDERVILSIIMQESHGYVGVRTTLSPEGIPTAGLMQCSGCAGFPGRTGLSQDEITSMVVGGTQHYKANLQNWGDKLSPESIYPALREYNSGSVNPNDLSDGRGATAAYVSDISQRLQGWVD